MARAGVAKRDAGVSQQARDDVARKRVDNQAMLIKSVGHGIVLLGVAAVVLACWPVAREFAGDDTKVEITVSLTIAVTLTGVAAVLALILRSRQKKVKHLQATNRKLAKQNHVLQKRLKDAGLPDTV